MTRSWTDSELDDTLAELAAALDRDAGNDDATLADLRRRLGAADPVTTTAGSFDVIEIGTGRTGATGATGRTGRVRGRGRIAPALLLAAVLVTAVALGLLGWPRSSDTSAPTRPEPGPTSTAQQVRQELALLPRPLPTTTDAVVLFETSGSGDAAFGGAFSVASFAAGGRPLALTYGFVCGDPTASPPPGDTGAFGATLPTYALADDSGVVARGSCSGIGDGTAAAGYASTGPLSAAPDGDVRVSVPRPDIVWRLVVSIAPVG